MRLACQDSRHLSEYARTSINALGIFFAYSSSDSSTQKLRGKICRGVAVRENSRLTTSVGPAIAGEKLILSSVLAVSSAQSRAGASSTRCSALPESNGVWSSKGRPASPSLPSGRQWSRRDSWSVQKPLHVPLEDAIHRGNWLEAKGLVDKLLSVGSLQDISSLDKLIKGLCMDGQFQTGWRLFRSCTEANHPLGYSTYQAMITAAFKAHLHLHDTDDQGGQREERVTSVVSVPYTPLLLQARQPQVALETFTGLLRSSFRPNVVTWTTIISGLSKHSKRGMPYAQQAYQLWKQLEASGEQTGNAAAHAAGMNACVGVGRIEEATSILETMIDSGLRPDVRSYNILLKGLAGSKDLEGMQRLLDDMRARQVSASVVTYNIVVDAFAQEGRLEEAKAWMDEAKELGLEPDVWSYSTLIKGFCQAERVRDAEEVLLAMKAHGVQPNVIVYTTLMDGFVRVGDLESAQRMLQDMRACGLQPNTITFNILLRGIRECPDKPVEDALLTVRDMGMAGVPPSTDTFNTLMSACFNRGDPASVPQLFRRLISLGHSPDALSYTSLIAALTRIERPRDAVLAFEAMQADGGVAVDVAAWCAAAHAYAHCGRMPEAEACLHEATQRSQQRGLAPPLEAYGALIAGYARRKDADLALSALQDFFELGGQPDFQMFDTVLEVCVRTGHFRRAMQVVRAMEASEKQVDKARIKGILEDVMRRQGLVQSRLKRQTRNEGLERLKFWLGIPNRYYSEDDSESEGEIERQRESESEGVA